MPSALPGGMNFKPGHKVILPDGTTGVIARRHQFIGTPWGGDYEVMTGEPGALGCGPWIYRGEWLEPVESTQAVAQ
jgi:hypothetical protein